MLKLLIADDEYLVIEFLQFIIEKNFTDIEVVGTAKSGREAIEKSMTLKPDIVIIDIKMPGINGIEAIEQIKAIKSDTMFIVISAYEYFDFAKEAVHLGVYEYLLKPINKGKMIKTLNEIKEKITMKRKMLQNEMILKEKFNRVLPLIERQFVYSAILNAGNIGDIKFHEDIFDMELKKGYIILGIVKDAETISKEENLSSNLEKQEFHEMFDFTLKKLTPCLVGSPLLDRSFAYIPARDSSDDYKIRNASIEIAKKLRDRIGGCLKINFKIGIGGAYDIENLSKSYSEALIASNFSTDFEVIHYEDIVSLSEKDSLYPEAKEKLLLQKLLRNDKAGVIDIYEDIFWWLSINYKDDIDKIKSRLIELFIIIGRNIPYSKMKNDFSEQRFIIKMLKKEDVNELKITYLNYLKELLFNLEETKAKEQNGMISKALSYINDNFQNNISLKDVAEELNISYHYFSKFFKDTFGKNFSDYLTELRIEKSKELLRDRTSSVKEICYSIGYNDPNYFSKIFRKITGMTPTEYRDR